MAFRYKKHIETVDEYIESFSPEVQIILGEIRATICKTVPEADESISYGMPAYKINGKPIAYFAAFPHHIGFYPLPHIIDKFKSELAVYKQGKGSIQFPINKPMPLTLIAEIIKARVAENATQQNKEK
ncbi:MAG: DUF1801 domain-containing protein [bacterium]